VWSELQTPDPYAARDYYCELMAWSTDDPNENPDFIAEDVCFLRNGSPLGRLREVRPSDVPDAPRWLPGFSVDSLRDATERASGLGATVSDVRAAIEGEQPPVALLTDPAGASCLLVE
jgi:predicted enzyme related to lactoylglutathione lyase